MTRTKRYGGFLIGDRVKCKSDGGEGTVKGMKNGSLIIDFDKCSAYIALMPNQLINLTRENDERLKVVKEELDRIWTKGIVENFRKAVDADIEKFNNLPPETKERLFKMEMERAKMSREEIVRDMILDKYYYGNKDIAKIISDPYDTDWKQKIEEIL